MLVKVTLFYIPVVLKFQCVQELLEINVWKIPTPYLRRFGFSRSGVRPQNFNFYKYLSGFVQMVNIWNNALKVFFSSFPSSPRNKKKNVGKIFSFKSLNFHCSVGDKIISWERSRSAQGQKVSHYGKLEELTKNTQKNSLCWQSSWGWIAQLKCGL